MHGILVPISAQSADMDIGCRLCGPLNWNGNGACMDLPAGSRDYSAEAFYFTFRSGGQPYFIKTSLFHKQISLFKDTLIIVHRYT